MMDAQQHGNTKSDTIKVIGIGDPVLDIIIPHVEFESLEAHELERGGSLSISHEEIDRLLSIPELSSEQSLRVPGGSAANVCKCLSQLNRLVHSRNQTTSINVNVLDISFIGNIGSDTEGKEYATMLQNHGVRPLLLESASEGGDSQITARCLCLITPDHQRTMRTFLGAAAELKGVPLEVKESNDLISLAHFEGYCMYRIDTSREIMRVMKNRGAKISLDLASFEIVKNCWDTLHETLEEGLVDIVFCNEDEAWAVAEKTLAIHSTSCMESTAALAAMRNSNFIEKAAKFLLTYCHIVVVSKGKDGCVAVSRNGERADAPAADVIVVDTVGAGDFFSAGFLFGWLHGFTLQKCAECGCAAGAAAVQVAGAELDEKSLMKLHEEIQCFFFS